MKVGDLILALSQYVEAGELRPDDEVEVEVWRHRGAGAFPLERLGLASLGIVRREDGTRGATIQVGSCRLALVAARRTGA